MLVGIRGAIVARENTREAILGAARELLGRLIETNKVQESSVASVFFTSTSDLTAAFPAGVLREIGWDKVPVLCAQELDIAGGMKSVVRVLLLVNCDSQMDPKHLYIGKARELRPDLAEEGEK